MNTDMAQIEAIPESQEESLLGEIQEVSANIPTDPNVNQNIPLEPIQDSTPPAKPRCYALICAIGASIISIVLGLSVGVMTEPVVHFEKDKRMTERQVELMTMVLHILSLVGSTIAGWASDRVGRRYTVILAGAFSFFGTILMGLFPRKGLLLFGRALTQVGVGFAPMVSAIYIVELSPTSSRGALTSLPQLFINISTIIGYLITYNTSKLHPNFGILAMFSLAASSLVVIAIGLCTMPESPAWLIMQGRLADAWVILVKTSESMEEAQLRFNCLKVAANIPVESNDDVVPVPQSGGEGVWWDLLHPIQFIRYMLISAICIHVLEQACGMDTILLYSPRVFRKLDISSTNTKLWLTVQLQLVKMAFSFIPTIFLDRFGRKKLLLYSVGGMAVSLAILGTSLTIIDLSKMKAKWVVDMCVASLFCCAAFYSIGLGPIPPIYSSEVFPLRLRAQGNVICLGLKQSAGAVMAVAFLPTYEVITLGGATFVFMVFTILGFFCINNTMPETRGRTLEEIWALFSTFIPPSSQGPDIELPRIDDPTVHGEDSGAPA